MSIERIKTINMRLRSISSAKTKCNKNPALHKHKLTELLLETNALLQEKATLTKPKATFTTLSTDQISMLDYEETRRALESIRSKISNERNSTDTTELNTAITLRDHLIAHRDTIHPSTRITRALLHELLRLDPTPDTWLHAKLKELITEP